MSGHVVGKMKRFLGKKGLSPCGDQPGRVKFKKKTEGALLAWILAHCKPFVRISIDVSYEAKMPCSTPSMLSSQSPRPSHLSSCRSRRFSRGNGPACTKRSKMDSLTASVCKKCSLSIFRFKL